MVSVHIIIVFHQDTYSMNLDSEAGSDLYDLCNLTVHVDMHFPTLAGTIALVLATAATALPTPVGSRAQSRQISSCESKWMDDYMDCIGACPDGGLTDSDCLDTW